MSTVDEFLTSVPPKEVEDAKKYILTLYDTFQILQDKGLLRLNLRGDIERVKFIDIMKTSS